MEISHYSGRNRVLVAVDCIIFGFDGAEMKILLIKRGFEPEKGRWSLMGGIIHPKETLDEATSRVLKELTGLENVYMEQLHTFGEVERDPVERTLSVVYFSLIDINKYKKADQPGLSFRMVPPQKTSLPHFRPPRYGGAGQAKAALQGCLPSHRF